MAVQGEPLVEPYSIGTVESASVVASRFPVPPLAWGFLIDDLGLDLAFDAMPSIQVSGIFMGGALSVEGTHLEPTIGQIWPR